MDPVEQLLSDLATLTSEQRAERIRALDAEQLAAFGEALNARLEEASAAEPSDESIAAIRLVTETARTAAEIVGEREAESERVRTEHEAALAEAQTALNGESDPEPDPTPDPPATDPQVDPANDPAPDPEADPAADPAPAADPVPEAVAAAAPPRVPLRRVRRPEQHEPVGNGRVRQVIVAAAGTEGADSEGHFPSMRALGQATLDLAHRIARSPAGMDHHVARLRTPFPEERTLRDSDIDGNTRKLTAVMGPQAIAAAGSVCAPFPVDYAINSLGTNQRPVKGALPSFAGQARGGIRYRVQPVLGDYAGMVSRWTTTTDEAAITDSTLRKPCIRIECGEFDDLVIEAITQCATVGNILAINDPELIAEAWDIASRTYSRTAEADLLTKMGAASTQVTTSQLLGAVLDMLAAIDMSVAAIRDTHRMGDTEQMRAFIPRWVRNAMKTDIARQLPSGAWSERLRAADADITSILESRDNLTIVWTLDSEAGATWPTQTDGALVNYPDTFNWLLYPEGTFATVEAPELNLGITRDTTTNAANDYQMFMEGFENVAKRGPVSYRFTTEICPNGATSGTIDPDVVCTAEGS